MASNFIPPIPIGQFKPSSEAIASWLYEVWKYLQENPIPSDSDIGTDITEIIAQNVPPMITEAIAGIEYSDIVTAASTLPVYRAANDEMGQQDLQDAWDEGCRFALVDDEAVYVLYKTGNTVNTLQILTQQQASSVISVNGKTGIVVLKTSDIQNDSGYITAAGAPVQSVNGDTGAVTIPEAAANSAGLMSAADKSKLNNLRVANLRVGTVVVQDIAGNGPWGMSATVNAGETFLCWIDVAAGGWIGAPFISDPTNAYTTVYSSVAATSGAYITGTYLVATLVS